MKKFFLLSFIGLFLLSSVTSQGFSQTAKDILEKMITAQGGREKMESIKDSSISGTILVMIPQNMSGPITIYWNNPNKSRVDVEIMGMKFIQATDGKIAWMDNPMGGGLQDMPEQRSKGFKRNSLGHAVLLNPEKYGITYVLKGKEKIDNHDYYLLERSYPDGHKTTLFVDSKTYLVFKTKSKSPGPQGGEVDRETLLSDYKKIEGTQVAHTLNTSIGGQDYTKITFKEVKYNSGLKDSMFDKPKVEKPKEEKPKEEEKTKKEEKSNK